MLLLSCLALPAQTPPPETAPPVDAAPTATPAVTENTNAAAVPALPGLPTPPGPRRPRSEAVRTVRPLTTPAAPGVTPVAPPATTPAPSGVPAAAVPAPTATTPLAVPGAAAATESPAGAGTEDVVFPAKFINFTGADLGMVLQKYAELVGRSMLRSPTAENALKQPVFFVNQTPLTRAEAIQAYQAICAMNGVALVEVDAKFLKVVTVAEALGTGQKPMITTNAMELSELGQFVTHIVQLKYVKPTEMMTVLTPFQSGKIPNAITAIDASQTIVMRDFTENVKRMLEMIGKVDTGGVSEFISEVIPIKFAKAEEIAQALSSLSGGGTAATMGGRTSTGPSGVGTRPGMGGYNPNTPGGVQTPGTLGSNTGTPSSGSSFSDRINRIISNASRMSASGAGDFQIIGPNKIVADVRSNSLMVFASRQDMMTIKKIIDQLDVVLAQVLIETVIMDVSLSDSSDIGFSYLQKKATESGKFGGIGAINNVGFLNQGNFSALTNGASALGSGFSYLGSFGQDLDVTLTAIAGNSSVKVVQKPRIMTSHATAGTIFIGSTVPYVSSTYYGGGYGGGPSSSYQQLRVGINLTVTPYVNQDGLVVMQIDEAIDELGEPVPITGVGDVPSTVSRTLSAEVAVQDRETIVLGGFIRNSGSDGKSGVPFLKDIPLLGALFSSTSKSKSRSELIVLMRPTVLRTPQLAAAHTEVEKARLPGIRHAEAENERIETLRANQADRKLGVKVPKTEPKSEPKPETKQESDRDSGGFLPTP